MAAGIIIAIDVWNLRRRLRGFVGQGGIW